MGLQIMDHRADIIGASLDIHRADGGGTIVTCLFPSKTH
jgi:nitrate/nitrite-specific signal transduction histidine kinase